MYGRLSIKVKDTWHADIESILKGRFTGGGGDLVGLTLPPSFRVPPKFIKRGKTPHTCTQIHRVLVLNS